MLARISPFEASCESDNYLIKVNQIPALSLHSILVLLYFYGQVEVQLGLAGQRFGLPKNPLVY